MNIIDKLTEIFKEFPGIGERQARRFVYFLMFKNDSYIDNLTKLILELKRDARQCKECFRFFLKVGGKDGGGLCSICQDSGTSRDTLMVLEKDSDLESVRKSGAYSGKYFVFGGLVPILEKSTKRRVRIEELKERVAKSKELKEIILAFSLNREGEHTDQYVRSELAKVKRAPEIKMSSLGRGLSTGTELEYSDNDTLKNALKNRQ